MAEWRTGRSVGRTIYRVQPDGSEELVGVMDTRELAAEVVAALNGRSLDIEGESRGSLVGAFLGSIPVDGRTIVIGHDQIRAGLLGVVDYLREKYG